MFDSKTSGINWFLATKNYEVVVGFMTSVGGVIMHPPRGPKGRGVAPIGATRGVH